MLISSKPTQGPRNPNQAGPVQDPSPNLSLHKPSFILLMGMFVLKSMVNVGRPFVVLLLLIYLLHVVCVVRWPFAIGRGMVNSWLKECANEHVSLCLNAGQALKKRLFTFRCWPPTACFFFAPVFQSLNRHDPFKWLFTCIRIRAKSPSQWTLVYNSIRVAFPAAQFSTLHNALYSLAATQAEIRRPKSSSSHTCGLKKSHYVLLLILILNSECEVSDHGFHYKIRAWLLAFRCLFLKFSNEM